jgi:UDP-2-acetamido-2-deoxy-ribo-hexuluronate aminotransferase
MNFIDLQEQYRRYQQEIDAAVGQVMEKATFIKGPFLQQFESELSAHCGAKHAIGCSSGTDALLLGLMVKDVKPGDEILVPDFTFIATAEMVSFIGAVPVFVDVQEDTLNIDPEKLEEKITKKTVGIIPVSLYGQCADMDEINSIAEKHGLWVMEDAAQSYGAEYKGKKSCTVSELATTSFFPAKPLGCYGDGGAVFTNDDETADKLRVLLNHGQTKRYHHSIIGVNGRLDGLQASVLSVKLRHFDEEMDAKQKIAEMYSEKLQGAVETPVVREYNRSVWAQYTVRHPERDRVTADLKEKGIPTAVHYPIPLHKQEAFAGLGNRDADFPVSVKASSEVFSLPMHPFLTEEEITLICDSIEEAGR